MAKNKPTSTRVTTPEVTLSFPHLFEPDGFEGQDKKHSVSMLFDSEHDLEGLKNVADIAARKKWGDNIPTKLESPFKSGDDKDPEKYPEYVGKMYVTDKRKAGDPPAVVDNELNPILNRKEIYGGVRARVAVSAYAWEYMGKKGVSFYLGNVQKTADGEPFGLVTSVEDDFEAPAF